MTADPVAEFIAHAIAQRDATSFMESVGVGMRLYCEIPESQREELRLRLDAYSAWRERNRARCEGE